MITENSEYSLCIHLFNQVQLNLPLGEQSLHWTHISNDCFVTVRLVTNDEH